jgi:hypothetical protein
MHQRLVKSYTDQKHRLGIYFLFKIHPFFNLDLGKGVLVKHATNGGPMNQCIMKFIHACQKLTQVALHEKRKYKYNFM